MRSASYGRRRPTLASRIGLLTTGVAAVAVLITGLVGTGLLRSSAAGRQRATLHDEAAVLAAALPARACAAPRSGLPAGTTPRRFRVLVVCPDGVRGANTRLLAAVGGQAAGAVRTGVPVSAARRVAGRRVLVEGAPAGGGQGVVLVQRAGTVADVGTGVVRRLLFALAAGLAVAAAAGLALSRRLTRPLARAAGAAHRLAGGERDVRLPPEGPAEVAEVTEALNRLAGALDTSERRQREFLLSVSHELRTPLTALTGFAEALADGVATDPRATGAVMRTEAHRLERLVADLLDLARLGAQDFRLDLVDVDVVALVREAAAVWSARCERDGVPFRLEAPAGPVRCRTDPTRLRQIVDGLAENALRVTPAGRPIVLALRADPAAAPGEAVVEVRDGGPGLTDDDLAVAFERAELYRRYRGVRAVGTGLGLALVAGLAGRLGGRASAGRAAEGGAAFAVRLPLLPAPRPGPLRAGGR